MNGADQVASALADLRAGRSTISWQRGVLAAPAVDIIEYAQIVRTVVDITPVYEEWRTQAEGDGFDPYDAVVLPIWQDPIVGYHNARTGVTRLGFVHAFTVDEFQRRWTNDDDPFDWSEVTHVHSVMAFVWSEQSPHGRGPLCVYEMATTADGRVLDSHWVAIEDDGQENSWPLLGVIVRAYDLLACRNVDLVEPTRQRAQRRRLERVLPGQRVTELGVFASGAWSRRPGEPIALGSVPVPLHTVRGHFAEYGVNGKGLLFGRIAGRFFIPRHVRGTAEAGETEQHIAVHGERSRT